MAFVFEIGCNLFYSTKSVVALLIDNYLRFMMLTGTVLTTLIPFAPRSGRCVTVSSELQSCCPSSQLTLADPGIIWGQVACWVPPSWSLISFGPVWSHQLPSEHGAESVTFTVTFTPIYIHTAMGLWVLPEFIGESREFAFDVFFNYTFL